MIEVLMPTYNAQRYLIEAIESIINQDYEDWSLLILDGGSTDATIDIVKLFSRRDNRIKLILSDGESPVDRVNKAILRGTADLMAFQHADDISAKDRLSKQFRYMQASKDVALLGGGTHYFNHDKQCPNAKAYVGTRQYPIGSLNIYARLPFYWCFSLPTIMFRRSKIIEDNLFFDTKYKFCADYDWFFNIAKKHKVDNLSDLILSYRHHSACDGLRNKEAVNRETNKIKEAIINYEFAYLSDNEKKVLLRVQVEPEVNHLTGEEVKRVGAIFDKVLSRSANNYREAYLSVFNEYLAALRLKKKLSIRKMIKRIVNSLVR